MPSQAYFESAGNGDWYVALEATSPGESPVTAPTKWAKLEIPFIFQDALALLAQSYLLAGEGQTDKRRAQEATAKAAVEDLVFNFTDRGAIMPPLVFAR